MGASGDQVGVDTVVGTHQIQDVLGARAFVHGGRHGHGAVVRQGNARQRAGGLCGDQLGHRAAKIDSLVFERELVDVRVGNHCCQVCSTHIFYFDSGTSSEVQLFKRGRLKLRHREFNLIVVADNDVGQVFTDLGELVKIGLDVGSQTGNGGSCHLAVGESLQIGHRTGNGVCHLDLTDTGQFRNSSDIGGQQPCYHRKAGGCAVGSASRCVPLHFLQHGLVVIELSLSELYFSTHVGDVDLVNAAALGGVIRRKGCKVGATNVCRSIFHRRRVGAIGGPVGEHVGHVVFDGDLVNLAGGHGCSRSRSDIGHLDVGSGHDLVVQRRFDIRVLVIGVGNADGVDSIGLGNRPHLGVVQQRSGAIAQ